MTVWPEWTRHLNDWPTWIKENCVQHLFRTYGSLGNAWAFLIFSLPLLIAYYQPFFVAQTCAPRFHRLLEITRLLQPLYVFKSFRAHLRLLLLSEQMRYPPRANLSQVQTLFQNCLHTAFWYASTTSYIFDRLSRILFDQNLYSSDVSLDNRVSSSTENFPASKALTHLKTVRTEMVWGPYISHNSLNICFESILSLMRHLI